MKKDRNCGGATMYPMYPTYPAQNMGMMPPTAVPGVFPGIVGPMGGMTPNMGFPMESFTTTTTVNSDYNQMEQQLNSMSSQINNLDRRVTRLENALNSSTSSYNTKYNNSNYQMM